MTKSLLILSLLVSPLRATPAELDSFRLAAAIKQVEGAQPETIGPMGERSEFQVTATVWRQHSSQPFATASSSRPTSRAEAHRVAVAHLKWCAERLAANGQPQTPFMVALAYGAGVSAAVRGTASREKRGYARRCANLYGEEG